MVPFIFLLLLLLPIYQLLYQTAHSVTRHVFSTLPEEQLQLLAAQQVQPWHILLRGICAAQRVRWLLQVPRSRAVRAALMPGRPNKRYRLRNLRGL